MIVAAADETFIKDLVKQKRQGYFRQLGGGAGIGAKLESDAERGIRGDVADVRRRKDAYGENTYQLHKPKAKSFLGHFRDALSDVVLVALLVCAAISIGFGVKAEDGLKDGWYEGVAIILAVFLVCTVSAVASRSQAQRQYELARESANIAVTVVRAGRRQDVSLSDVVVGDVAILKAGDAVPADGVFLEGHGLQVDEWGIMTVEPNGIDIDAQNNPFLAAGAKVVQGHGRMLVTAVGADTVLGELMNAGENNSEGLVTLQERLDGLTTTIGNVGIAVALVAFTLLAARHFTGSSGTGKTPPLVDKGVPLAVTLMATFAMRRMVKENAMVHHLSALETLGSVTAICVDKTGTLTLNQMEVADFWVGTDHRPRAATEIAGGILSLLHQGSGLNTTGSVYWPDNVSPPEISGSPTDKALLSWAMAYLDMDAVTLKKSCEVVQVEAFNSDKKHTRAIIREKATGTVVAHWKGTPEVLLANCSLYVDIHGAVHELGLRQMKKIDKVINDMSEGGLQCIAFAYKQIDDEGLTLLGLVGLKDRCRPDVKATVEACRKAGVTVKMVTSDNILAARAIATECGVMSSNDTDGIVIEGHEFRATSTVRQLEMVDKIHAVALSRPLDKLALVKRLKQKGHVVAVTTGGEDACDAAAALKEADVVLSMSIKGTDLSADKDTTIVVLNDEFHTVATAIQRGRCAYNNFQRFIQFHLTVNVVVILVNFVSAITAGKVPLTTVQILWANLVMGTTSVLAAAVDMPTEALMHRPPIARTASLMSNAMWRNLVAQAAFQIIALLALQYRGTHGNMIIFNVFVLCQVFNEFNLRDMDSKNILAGLLGKKKMFLVVVAATLALQVATVEALTKFAGTERLGLGQWGVCLAIAAVSWPVGLAVKFIPVTS